MKSTIILLIIFSIFGTNQLISQEITMFPGVFSMKYYQDDTPISKQQFETLLLKDTEANQLWKKSKQHLTIGLIAYGAEIGLLLWQFNGININENEPKIGPLIGAVGFAGVALGFGLSANKLRREAILTYNKNLELGSINFGPTYNGVGLVMSF